MQGNYSYKLKWGGGGSMCDASHLKLFPIYPKD